MIITAIDACRLDGGPGLSEIGVTGSECPHCGVEFVRRPLKKVSCQHCGEAVHVRTRPIDGVRVLVRPSDLAQLEVEWQALGDLKDFIRSAWDSPRMQQMYRDLMGPLYGYTPLDWALVTRYFSRTPAELMLPWSDEMA